MPSAYRIVWSNPWVRVGVGIGAIALIATLLYLLRPILVPLFFAFIVAYIFDPLADFFEKRHVSRLLTAVGLVVVITLSLILFPLFIIPGVVEQADRLMAVSRELDTDPWLARLEERLPLERFVETMGWRDEAEPDMSALDVLGLKLGNWIQDNAGGFLRAHAESVLGAGTTAGEGVTGFLRSLGDWVMGLVIFLGNFALFVFVMIYLLKDYDIIIATGNNLVPPRYRPKVGDIMHRIDVQLRSFLRGQFMVVCCLGAMYAVGFLIADVLFAVPLAIFGAVASFVPYLGAALTIGPACLLTIMVHGFDWHILAVLGTFAFAQFMEGNILTPRIVGSQVGLGPVWVILAILVFSSALGFPGLLLAVPMAAVLKVLVMELLVLYKTSRFFEGAPLSAESLVPESDSVSLPVPMAEAPSAPRAARRASSRRKTRE